MSDVAGFLWMIPALPLAAAVVTAVFGPRLMREYSHWPCILACLGACVVSVMTFLAVHEGVFKFVAYQHADSATRGPAPDPHPQQISVYYEWIKVGDAGTGR